MRVERRPHDRVVRHREGRGEGGIGGEELVIFPPDRRGSDCSGCLSLWPGAPSPCSMIVSIAASALLRSLTTMRPGSEASAGPSCAAGSPTNKAPLAEMVGEHFEPVTNAAIEMPDRRVVLGARHQSSLRQGPVIVGGRHELAAVAQVLALGPLEEDEVVEHGARESAPVRPRRRRGDSPAESGNSAATDAARRRSRPARLLASARWVISSMATR